MSVGAMPGASGGTLAVEQAASDAAIISAANGPPNPCDELERRSRRPLHADVTMPAAEPAMARTMNPLKTPRRYLPDSVEVLQWESHGTDPPPGITPQDGRPAGFKFA